MSDDINIQDELDRIDRNIEGIHGRLSRYSEMYVEEDKIKEDLEILSEVYSDLSDQLDILSDELRVLKDEMNNIKRAQSIIRQSRDGQMQDLT
jgi:archaellum component FlaC